MNPKMRLGIRQKLLIPVLAIILIAMVSLSFYAYGKQKETIVTLLNSSAATALTQLEANVATSDAAIAAMRQALNKNYLRQVKAIAELIAADSRQLQTEKMQALAQHIGVEEIHVTDKNGVLKWGNVPDFFGFDFHGTEQTRPFLGGLTNPGFELAQKAQPRGTDQVLFQYIGVARKDQLGIVQIGVAPRELEQVIAKNDLNAVVKVLAVGEDGYGYIANQQGIIIAHPNKETLGINLNDFPWGKEILQIQNGSLTYTYEGIEKIAHFQTDNDRLLVTTLPTIEVKRPLATARNNFILFNVITLFITTLVIVMLMQKSIIKPILFLKDTLQEISEGEGDLTKRIHFVSNDEIGDLSGYFDKFMDQLQTMIRNIRDGAFQMAASSSQINTAMHEVAQTVEGQAGTSEEISATIAELSANSDEVSANSEQTSANVTQISQTVQNLKEGIQYLGEQFEQLDEKSLEVTRSADEGVASIEESNRIIQQMANSSRLINERINAVNDIAEQIKLLALNAAIVAAQAGEHGKGFSVVADAINGLAQQAGKTADEITHTVQENVKIAEQGLQVSKKTLSVMQSISEHSAESSRITKEVNAKVQEQVIAGNEIAVASEDAAQRVHHVSTAMHEQNNAVSQVTEAVEQLAGMATETAASVEQVSVSNNKMLEIAENLKKMVEKFKLEADNKATGLRLR